jgi:hypothetical protein
METVERYLEVFEALRRRRRWSSHTSVLRFAALSLAAADLDDPAGELEEAAISLKRKAGWFGPLNSPIRYAIAAMILRKGLKPVQVHDRVMRTRERFRERKLPRGGTQEVLAALLLVLQNEGRPVHLSTVDRVGAILDRWKKDHWWLTGSDDYPMASLHAQRGEDVEGLARKVEGVYQQLRSKKFSRGNPLQLASHILTLGQGGTEEAVRRFVEIRDAFRREGLKVGPQWYDEVALLALTSSSPVEIVRQTVKAMNRLLAVRPKPTRNIAFSLATGVTMTEYARGAEGLEDTRDLSAITAAQAILDAQTAAMVACMAATTAATTAATASS